MGEFLGREECIESLRRDLVDLQGATLDVFSRSGPVRFSSWKFPDKLSCNLDMVALLERYDFVDGDEAYSQHSHFVLLELVIDRLLLLLQSFNAYVEQRCGHRRDENKGCQSVGPVVRNYWSNLVEFAKIQGNNKDSRCNERETPYSVSHQTTSRSDFCRPSTGSSQNSFNHVTSSHTHGTLSFLKVDSQSVSCQTEESVLFQCDACHQVQSHLRKTGRAFVEMFLAEGLPSSLQRLLGVQEDTLEQGQMTAADVAQWANEQLRDTRRLGKHLQDVRGTVQPLTDRLSKAETERDRFRSQLEKARKEFMQEIEKHQANIVQLEFSLKKAQRSMKETEQRLQEEQQQLKKDALCLEESNSRLKGEVALHQETLQVLECEKIVLQNQVKTLQVKEEACCELQQRILQFENQISETQRCLDKENAKYQSACRQQESMQAKQTALLKRVDALDEECEELQRQLGESEQRQIGLHSQLQQMLEEREQTQAQLAQQQSLCLELQKEKTTLEANEDELKRSVTELEKLVQALRQRERLLVAFPELSPLTQSQPQSTGNVLLDMEQQLQANNIRIKVLGQENTTLHTSLVKLRERVQRDFLKEASPRQAWSETVHSMPAEQQQSHEMQMSLLQSSSVTQLGCFNREKESGLDSAASGDRMSSNVAASPTSLQLNLQTLQLKGDFTAAERGRTKTRGSFLLARSRSSNQRRK